MVEGSWRRPGWTGPSSFGTRPSWRIRRRARLAKAAEEEAEVEVEVEVEVEAEAACAPPAAPKPRGCDQEMSASEGAYARTWISSRPAARPRWTRSAVTSSERKRRADASV